MEKEKYFPDLEQIKEKEKLGTTKDQKIIKLEEKTDNEADEENVIDLKSEKFSPNNFELPNEQLKKEKNEEEIRERKEKLKEEIGEFELSQRKETLARRAKMEGGEIKNYADNEKVVTMSKDKIRQQLQFLRNKDIYNMPKNKTINVKSIYNQNFNYGEFAIIKSKK